MSGVMLLFCICSMPISRVHWTFNYYSQLSELHVTDFFFSEEESRITASGIYYTSER